MKKSGALTCSTPSITRSRPLRYPYQLKGHTLALQDTTKYLSVDLQSSLSWKKHIDRIKKKSNSMLGFLCRNLESSSAETKTNAYIRTRQAHSKKFRQISTRTDSYKFSFFPAPSQFGIPSQHQSLGIFQEGGIPPFFVSIVKDPVANSLTRRGAVLSGT